MKTNTISYGKYSIDLTTGKVSESKTKIKPKKRLKYELAFDNVNRETIYNKDYVINLKSGEVKSLKENKTIIVSTPKRYVQIDLNNNNTIVASFDSINDIKKALNIDDASHVNKVINGKRKTAYGFKWVDATKTIKTETV